MAKRKTITEAEIQTLVTEHENWQREWATPDRILYVRVSPSGNMVSGSIHTKYANDVPADATIVPPDVYLAIGRISEELRCRIEYKIGR